MCGSVEIEVERFNGFHFLVELNELFDAFADAFDRRFWCGNRFVFVFLFSRADAVGCCAGGNRFVLFLQLLGFDAVLKPDGDKIVGELFAPDESALLLVFRPVGFETVELIDCVRFEIRFGEGRFFDELFIFFEVLEVLVEDGKSEGDIAVGGEGREEIILAGAPEIDLVFCKIELERIKSLEIEIKEFA